MPSSRCSSLSRPSTCACTVTSSAVVGSSASSTSGFSASAMAIMTRWRWPPDSSCGCCAMREAACGMRDRVECLDRQAVRLARADGPMGADGLRHLPPDRQHRVERGHRLLEDHGDAVAADGAHLALAKRGNLLPAQHDRAAAEAHAGLRQQPHHGQRRHRLARSGLAGEAERLAGAKVEGQVADQRDDRPAPWPASTVSPLTERTLWPPATAAPASLEHAPREVERDDPVRHVDDLAKCAGHRRWSTSM